MRRSICKAVFDKYSGSDKVWVAVCHREHFSISGNKGHPGNNCNKAKTKGTPGVIGQPGLLSCMGFSGITRDPDLPGRTFAHREPCVKVLREPGQICFNDRQTHV